MIITHNVLTPYYNHPAGVEQPLLIARNNHLSILYPHIFDVKNPYKISYSTIPRNVGYSKSLFFNPIFCSSPSCFTKLAGPVRLPPNTRKWNASCDCLRCSGAAKISARAEKVYFTDMFMSVYVVYEG